MYSQDSEERQVSGILAWRYKRRPKGVRPDALQFQYRIIRQLLQALPDCDDIFHSRRPHKKWTGTHPHFLRLGQIPAPHHDITDSNHTFSFEPVNAKFGLPPQAPRERVVERCRRPARCCVHPSDFEGPLESPQALSSLHKPKANDGPVERPRRIVNSVPGLAERHKAKPLKVRVEASTVGQILCSSVVTKEHTSTLERPSDSQIASAARILARISATGPSVPPCFEVFGLPEMNFRMTMEERQTPVETLHSIGDHYILHPPTKVERPGQIADIDTNIDERLDLEPVGFHNAWIHPEPREIVGLMHNFELPIWLPRPACNGVFPFQGHQLKFNICCFPSQHKGASVEFNSLGNVEKFEIKGTAGYAPIRD
ncbi:hypothetical protein DFH08DRAFT_992826 [Mycena albidolilacea]|uniref:Uncharacterized protein n=1 Tax=Mycena albidolilacea TaxID=1033008 RepID=A0AAD7A8K1_9AGAR|nr:hypothetical protein DFH08DRAFT_992826 [Mycena albidolilacea]